jgi:hypothetical protein
MKKIQLIFMIMMAATVNCYAQDTLVEVLEGTSKLNARFEEIIIKNHVAEKETTTFEIKIENNDTIYEVKEFSYTFKFTDEKWNHLEIFIVSDSYHPNYVSGRYNGRRFSTNEENGDLIFEDNKQVINAWFEVD